MLQQFYAELVKIGGKEYEPESLKVMIAAIDRYVREKCGDSVVDEAMFWQCGCQVMCVSIGTSLELAYLI